eukprot:194594_1
MDVRSKDFFKWDKQKHTYGKDNLVTNIIHDEKKQLISCNINIDHEYFRRQLLPFYSLATELYEYEVLVNGLRHVMKDIHSKKQFKSKFVGGAQYQSKFELFKLTASHPTYIETYYKNIDNGRFYETIQNFYHSKGGSIVATLYSKAIRFTEKQFKQFKIKRQIKTEKWKQKYIEPTDNEFNFALPHMVGHNSKKLVFLSDLKEENNNIYSLYCDGLNTMNKNFTFHPYHGGSGDHINSGGVQDILYQFIHLIVRNAKKFKYLKDKIIKKYGNDFDIETSVIVGSWYIKYKKSLELNTVYMVKLLNLKCIDDDMKYPFVFEIKLKIVQHGIETTDVMLKVYPVFSRCRL